LFTRRVAAFSTRGPESFNSLRDERSSGSVQRTVLDRTA
jgi:hypothetical protein